MQAFTAFFEGLGKYVESNRFKVYLIALFAVMAPGWLGFEGWVDVGDSEKLKWVVVLTCVFLLSITIRPIQYKHILVRRNETTP